MSEGYEDELSNDQTVRLTVTSTNVTKYEFEFRNTGRSTFFAENKGRPSHKHMMSFKKTVSQAFAYGWL